MKFRKIENKPLIRSKCVDVELTPIKRTFTKITVTDITTFKEEMAGFSETFFAQGPGSVGSDLEKGLELLKEYKKLFAGHEGQRLELGNAERLFDLDVTAYPNMNKVKNELEGQ